MGKRHLGTCDLSEHDARPAVGWQIEAAALHVAALKALLAEICFVNVELAAELLTAYRPRSVHRHATKRGAGWMELDFAMSCGLLTLRAETLSMLAPHWQIVSWTRGGRMYHSLKEALR
jgi:hypothetical protein